MKSTFTFLLCLMALSAISQPIPVAPVRTVITNELCWLTQGEDEKCSECVWTQLAPTNWVGHVTFDGQSYTLHGVVPLIKVFCLYPTAWTPTWPVLTPVPQQQPPVLVVPGFVTVQTSADNITWSVYTQWQESVTVTGRLDEPKRFYRFKP